MKVLVDTNILLDIIFHREPHFLESKRVFDCCISFVDGYIAVHSFSNLFYVLHETEGWSVDECRSMLNKLLCVFDVASLNKTDMIAAVNNGDFDDLEDSMQYEAANSCGIDCIITRNTKDFKNASVPIVIPSQFLQLVHEQNN